MTPHWLLINGNKGNLHQEERIYIWTLVNEKIWGKKTFEMGSINCLTRRHTEIRAFLPVCRFWIWDALYHEMCWSLMPLCSRFVCALMSTPGERRYSLCFTLCQVSLSRTIVLTAMPTEGILWKRFTWGIIYVYLRPGRKIQRMQPVSPKHTGSLIFLTCLVFGERRANW